MLGSALDVLAGLGATEVILYIDDDAPPPTRSTNQPDSQKSTGSIHTHNRNPDLIEERESPSLKALLSPAHSRAESPLTGERIRAGLGRWCSGRMAVS